MQGRNFEKARTDKLRFLRFTIWTLLMLVSSLLTTYLSPKHAVLIPCAFIVLVWPMVMMPLPHREHRL